MPKILLVNPPTRTAKEECCSGVQDSLFIPAQPILSCAYLRSQGFDVDFIDARVQKLSLDGYNVVVSWASVFDSLYDDIKVLSKAKLYGAKTIVILNDPYETLEEELLLHFSFIDVAIRLWDRERTLARVLRAILSGNDELKRIRGIVFRKGKQVIDTGKSSQPQDLSHLIDSSSILGELPLEKYDEGWVLSGKGCPYRCTFCLYRVTKHLSRNPKYVANELETMYAAGIDSVYVLDLNLLMAPLFAKNLAHEIVKRKINISWRTDARVEHCSKELLAELSRSGLSELIIGIESADPNVLIKIMKDLKLNIVFKAYENCNMFEIRPTFHYMYGFPWDDSASAMRIVKLANALAYAKHSVNWVRPLIGTPLYDQMLKFNVVPQLSLDDYVNRRALSRRTLKLSTYDLVRNFVFILANLDYLNDRSFSSYIAANFFDLSNKFIDKVKIPSVIKCFMHYLSLPFVQDIPQIPKHISFWKTNHDN
ncbi:hypothetical protein DRN86_00170 [Candidatus Geothermarchaeota archaeon]|nr:MAG: hypothetical protein DRN86_00170 [Candidatus Geothermarchaeota archaeon]